MTYKEKVAEIMPESIDDECDGGVECCPSHYSFLNAQDICCQETCTKCWNQQMEDN